MSTAHEILITRRDARVDVVLNRPHRHNAFTTGMYTQLTELFTQLADDLSARVVIIRGAGGAAFAAGNDISGFLGMTGEQITGDYDAMVMGMLDALYHLPQVTIAAVEGICVGGGLAVATCCDVRVATPDARFGYPIARTLGNALSRDVLIRCLHVFGEPLTRAMLLTSRTVSAHRALGVGALLEIADDSAQLDALTDELAAGIERAAPLTIQTTKRQLAQLTAAEHDPQEVELLRAVYDSPGFREGVRAFLAKEKPQFPADRLPARPASTTRAEPTDAPLT